jgi:hypothetical protein
VQNAQRHGATDDEIICTLANAISDGLMRGNWPWPPPPQSTDDSYLEWLAFTDSLRTFNTQSRIENLKDWYNDRPHTHLTEDLPGGSVTSGRDDCLTCREVSGYIRRMAIQGRIEKHVHLIDALTWDWNLKVLK